MGVRRADFRRLPAGSGSSTAADRGQFAPGGQAGPGVHLVPLAGAGIVAVYPAAPLPAGGWPLARRDA